MRADLLTVETFAACKGGGTPKVQKLNMPQAPELGAVTSIDTSRITSLLASQGKTIQGIGRSLIAQQATNNETNAAMQQALLDAMPEPMATPPPPPSMSSQEVQEARDQERRDASMRKGLSKSIIAGETGAPMQPPPPRQGGQMQPPPGGKQPPPPPNGKPPEGQPPPPNGKPPKGQQPPPPPNGRAPTNRGGKQPPPPPKKQKKSLLSQ